MNRRLLPVCLLVASFVTAEAEVLEFSLKAGQDREITLPTAVDDESFSGPTGYAVAGVPARVFTRSIELKNTGEKPMTGRLLVVNDRDVTNAAGLRRTLGLSAEPISQRRSMEKLFSFWKDHRVHAGSWQGLAAQPFAALHFWGYTLCGEDTQALARLAFLCEVPARFVPLNGHIAAEYRYDGDWHLFDSDLNAFYLQLDNRTVASAEDVRADPFLALRTKAFGRYSPHELSASAYACGLLEFVKLTEPSLVKLKVGPAPLNTFTLQPGETLIWHADTPPPKPIGKLDDDDPEELRKAMLATIEHRINAQAYPRGEAGVIQIPSAFPILQAVNRTTGDTAPPSKDGTPLFKAALIVQGDKDDITVFSQCSRNALPLLRHGANRIRLDAGDGTAQVTYRYDPQPTARPPGVKVTSASAKFVGSPIFKLSSQPAAVKFWWQVSEDRDFTLVAPSLEGIAPWSPELRFDPLTDTFLSSGRLYFLRVKGQSSEVWGEWSETLEFRVQKPVRPTGFRFTGSTAGDIKLSWASTDKGVEYLIFGSNRRDFVPEVFSEEEIVSMENLKPMERRPNKNLIATTKELSAEFAPQSRFYRVIARRGKALSVPGPLLVLPPEFGKDLPPPTILQVRLTKEGSAEIYRGKEEQLPDAPEPAKETTQETPAPDEGKTVTQGKKSAPPSGKTKTSPAKAPVAAEPPSAKGSPAPAKKPAAPPAKG